MRVLTGSGRNFVLYCAIAGRSGVSVADVFATNKFWRWSGYIDPSDGDSTGDDVTRVTGGGVPLATGDNTDSAGDPRSVDEAVAETMGVMFSAAD
ncbi:hypothetical protein J6590_069025 [Homalodisca vitripennis]|nr:hypothetical protein J6590_069025 [Homalodisca vitripennis]